MSRSAVCLRASPRARNDRAQIAAVGSDRGAGLRARRRAIRRLASRGDRRALAHVFRLDRVAIDGGGRRTGKFVRPRSPTTSFPSIRSSRRSIAKPRSIENLVRGLRRLRLSEEQARHQAGRRARDRETLSRILALRLPARYEVIVAPPGEPSTKPRALNIALASARGDCLASTTPRTSRRRASSGSRPRALHTSATSTAFRRGSASATPRTPGSRRCLRSNMRSCSI